MLMKKTVHILLFAIFILSGQFIGAESTFVELHLSSDGVYGVDSSGKEWEYDFSRERFVRESTVSAGTQTVFGREAQKTIDEVDATVKAEEERLLTM